MTMSISATDLTGLAIGLLGVVISLTGIMLLRPARAEATTAGERRSGADGEGLGSSG